MRRDAQRLGFGDAVGSILFLIAIGYVLLYFNGCSPAPQPQPPPPQPLPEGGVATCSSYCENAANLGCAFSAPTPEGTTCEQVCGNVQGSGVISWNLACRTTAATCAAIDQCEQ